MDSNESDKEKLSVIGVLLRILKEEGISGYYRGFLATMLNTFSMREWKAASVVRSHSQIRYRIRIFLLLFLRAHVVHQAFGCEATRRKHRAAVEHSC